MGSQTFLETCYEWFGNLRVTCRSMSQLVRNIRICHPALPSLTPYSIYPAGGISWKLCTRCPANRGSATSLMLGRLAILIWCREYSLQDRDRVNCKRPSSCKFCKVVLSSSLKHPSTKAKYRQLKQEYFCYQQGDEMTSRMIMAETPKTCSSS